MRAVVAAIGWDGVVVGVFALGLAVCAGLSPGAGGWRWVMLVVGVDALYVAWAWSRRRDP